MFDFRFQLVAINKNTRTWRAKNQNKIKKFEIQNKKKTKCDVISPPLPQALGKTTSHKKIFSFHKSEAHLEGLHSFYEPPDVIRCRRVTKIYLQEGTAAAAAAGDEAERKQNWHVNRIRKPPPQQLVTQDEKHTFHNSVTCATLYRTLTHSALGMNENDWYLLGLQCNAI